MTSITLQNGFSLHSGYQPGLVGWVSMLHGQNYIEKWDFGSFFECRVASELSSFMEGFNPAHSQIWSLMKDGKFFGSITVDGSHADKDGAHLRWFILAPQARGYGFGKLLLDLALQFAQDHHFPSIYLWTLEGLEPAGKLYRTCGFKLEESLTGNQWGKTVQEERLRLTF